ncbi:MAG: hypothetical protein U0X20_11705 [Caldilineaceae bacterium]
MFGSSHFDRAVRALTERIPTPWGWRPKFGARFAHNALASLLLFLIAFLFMGIPVFASAGGPPVARHVTVIQRSMHKGGSGINPIKHTNITFAGGSGINPVKHVATDTEGGSGITPIKHVATDTEGGSGITPVKRSPSGSILPVK